jgi:hypothetical protein
MEFNEAYFCALKSLSIANKKHIELYESNNCMHN